jgi:hypothetical protein
MTTPEQHHQGDDETNAEWEAFKADLLADDKDGTVKAKIEALEEFGGVV